MSDQVQPKPLDGRSLIVRLQHHLPRYIARGLLRPGEEVTFVRGPRWNPKWECYMTHPAMLLFPAAIGGCWWLAARKLADADSPLQVLAPATMFILLLVCLFALGIANGYFTRLVVTNFRMVILQGCEVCRGWDINRLPKSLLRYGLPGADGLNERVNLDALKSMLGAQSDQVVDARTILAFGKNLDAIKKREDGRP
jgi:hypothetical protein